MSLLEPEGDSRWFNPFALTHWPQHQQYQIPLTSQEQTMIDFCACFMFAPAKLMRVKASQKLSATEEILKTAHQMYQAD